MPTRPFELSPEQLRRLCAPEEMQFGTTAEVERLEEIIGQERATRAIEFGLTIVAEGFNIFVMGPDGAGKSSTILRYLQQRAASLPTPADWAYVGNAQDAYRPRTLSLPAGKGRAASGGLRDALRQVEGALRSAFGGAAYEDAQAELRQSVGQQQQQMLQQLDAFAQQHSFTLVETPTGLVFAPMAAGKALSGEEFGALSPAEREGYNQHEPALNQAMERTLRAMQRMQEEVDERLADLNRRVAAVAVHPLFAPLVERFAECAAFVGYVEEVEKDIVERVVERRLGNEGDQTNGEGEAPAARNRNSKWIERYTLNLVVEHDDVQGAPVVHEINPSYPNLLGRVEYRAEFGTLIPDHHTIRPGALHRANGGYLVVDARAMLGYPMAWEGLKRALRYREIRIDDPASQAGAVTAASLAPDAIPLEVKVVLIGDPETYFSLYYLDGSFAKLFKVRADFAGDMERTNDNLLQVARFIRTRTEEEKLRAFSTEAVAEIVEYAGRLVESQERLTTRFAFVADLLREADYWAGQEGAAVVGRNHVQKAIAEHHNRSSLYEEVLLRTTLEGVLLIATRGEAVGQVNGLAVQTSGDYEFGRPHRITVSVYLGNRGVINIEREADLSGSIHNKGVLILAGFLGRRFGQDKPLSINASIAFEQSYDGVDGDSASSTELYALLSALGDIPLQQGIAVTGSVNQLGEIQAVGGVTAKIEGFFDVCRAQGLTGKQGVIMPAANVSHLMLRQDVIDAVAAGMFHIWPVRNVDDGFAILCGMPAGERLPNGRFSEGSFNRRVDDRLRQMATTLAKFTGGAHSQTS